MRKIFLIAQILALASLVMLGLYIDRSLDIQYALGQADHQRSVCTSLPNRTVSPECRDILDRVRDSRPTPEGSRSYRGIGIFAMLSLLGVVNLFSIFFALKYFRRSSSHHKGALDAAVSR